MPLAVSSAGVPVEAGSCRCESVACLHGLAIGRDSWSMNIVNLHIGKLNLCYVTYISNGRREREGERRREWESTLQDHVIYNKMRIALCVYPTIFPCVDPPAPALSVFHGNLPQEICGVTSLMFIMGKCFPSWGINELEFSRQNQKFSSTYP